ncbi:MAG: 2Fe-2S iron-sulfur cluster-binding protein [Pseudomonadota bacterium]
MSGFRLAGGTAIDRSRPLSFSFDGQSYKGFAGDTLASALIANGVQIIGRSFKYHRPRGVLAAGIEEPNAIVTIGEGALQTPNLKATTVRLTDGLVAQSVNRWPSLSVDALAVSDVLRKFIPAGFYYKTFKRPDWMLFEPWIRKAAGLGRAPSLPDPDRYEHRYEACDLLVIGGGLAGLTAARAASVSGANVIIAEMDDRWGGDWVGDPQVDGQPLEQWSDATASEIENAAAGNRTLLRTMAFGIYDGLLTGLVQQLDQPDSSVRERLIWVRPKRIVVATGAIERPLPIANNDVPGVMLSRSAAVYAERYGVAVGAKPVAVVGDDEGYDAALHLKRSGVDVGCVIDVRAETPQNLRDQLSGYGIECVNGARAVRVVGRRAVRAIEYSASGHKVRRDCDAVLVSGGWSPTVHLAAQAGAKLTFDAGAQCFVPSAIPAGISVVGSARGQFAAPESLAFAVKEMEESLASPTTIGCPEVTWEGAGSRSPTADAALHTKLMPTDSRAWIDLQNDVTLGDVKLAIQEGFRSVEHVKRYTTLGMATDQGKTSNVNGIAAMASCLDRPIAEVGTTKFRPPFDPVSLGVFAGTSVGNALLPRRHLPARAVHQQLGAQMEDYGSWSRPSCYPQHGESEHEAICREAKAVRSSVGLFDASPLGKIEVFGPDAAVFLNLFCYNTMSSIKPGRCRYALMLNEEGVVIDDGVTARLGPDHFVVGTTSGHADMIASSMIEWLQCEWQHLDVVVENVTSNWGVVNVNGPKARELLERCSLDLSLAPDEFKHMGFVEGTLAGVPCRIQRVSFSGELSYEVAVPSSYTEHVLRLMLKAGEDLGVVPFGVEALMCLRIEKGFIHVGSETDGTTLPDDLGFGGIRAKKKSDFIGRRSLTRRDALRPGRRQFVGIRLEQSNDTIDVGAHVQDTSGDRSIGWVSSSAYSPTLERPVLLAMIENGRARHGDRIKLFDRGQTITGEVILPCQFDPDGARLNG